MVKRGGKLEQAEDKDLLIHETILYAVGPIFDSADRSVTRMVAVKQFNHLPNIEKIVDGFMKKIKRFGSFEGAKRRLSYERDNFIAQRINETLQKKGIAFFGGLHSFVDKLEKDIKVEEKGFFNDEISQKLIKGYKK